MTLNSGTVNLLYKVHFPANDTGYVVGELGTILKTTDGGTNWITLNSGTTLTLRGVYFATAITGFAVGDSGIILKTDDGGINWTKYIYNNAMASFTAVQFINNNVGFAAGYEYPPLSPMILKTTDGGSNWNNTIINGGVQYVVSSMHFPVADTGYAFLYGEAVKTVDGGNTWNSIPISPSLNIDFVACFFTDATTGYVGGWYYVPRLGKTTDGCINWTIESDSMYGITSIYFPDTNTGYATTTQGIIKTTDAGNSWNKITDTSFTYSVRSLYFTDISTGYAVGGNGTIIKTTNGGVGINEMKKESEEIIIHPNPMHSTATLTISSFQRTANYELIIYNVFGSIVFQSAIRDSKSVIKRDGLPGGIYFYKISARSNFIATGKVIIQ
jgi:photosystem II stability/assembly factor-like uncharacterized protein